MTAASEVRQQAQQTQQSTLDHQLVAEQPHAVGFLCIVQAHQRLGVIGKFRGQMNRQGQASALQWQKVALVAQVVRPAQQRKIKNNIFIFHHNAGGLEQGMKGPWRKNKDFSRLCRQGTSPDLHNAAAFFDEHQFHTALPVQRHFGKILRNRARVNVERKT